MSLIFKKLIVILTLKYFCNKNKMKTTLIFLALIYVISAIPYDDQMALANSLIVGRDGDTTLYDWTCKVCDASNKPLHAHFI